MEFIMMVIAFLSLFVNWVLNVLKTVHFVINFFSPLGEPVKHGISQDGGHALLEEKLSVSKRDTRKIHACPFVILFEQEL